MECVCFAGDDDDDDAVLFASEVCSKVIQLKAVLCGLNFVNENCMFVSSCDINSSLNLFLVSLRLHSEF